MKIVTKNVLSNILKIIKKLFDNKADKDFVTNLDFIKADKDYVDKKIVQPDWNQNDETKFDYIKNRICYDDSVTEVFYPKKEITATEGEYCVVDANFKISFKPGEVYRVLFNGKIYDQVANNDHSPVYIGDYYTEDPFWIYISPSNGLKIKTSIGGSGLTGKQTFDFKIDHIVEKRIKKIDKEFLPETPPYILPIAGSNILGGIYADPATDDDITLVNIDKNGKLKVSTIGKKMTNNGEIFNNYNDNKASGYYSHAEGDRTKASGNYSHAEGINTTASGRYSSHAEGFSTRSRGDWGSHAEGDRTEASGDRSHAEGYITTASGNGSHAEGYNTTASGNYSHAEGISTTASGNYSHAEGNKTTASSDCQHVQGKYNIDDPTGKYAHIVGNGRNDTSTNQNLNSNAHTLDWQGNAWFQGKIKVGGTGWDDPKATEISNGLDGGHYTPQVTQPDPDHLQFSFAPSLPGMSPVDPVTVDLPKGSGGGGDLLQPLTFTGAVEASYDGTEAVSVEIPAGGGGASTFKRLIDFTLDAPGKYINDDFDMSLSEYVLTIIVLKTEQAVKSNNSSFMGASGFLYYIGLGSNSYNTRTEIYWKKIAPDRSFQVFSQSYADSPNPNTIASGAKAQACTYSATPNRGINIAGELPKGTRIILDGR